MAKTVNIKLSSSTGSSTGPTFDLFSDANSYASAFESGVSKTTLMGVGGYTSTVVPDAATIIRVKSTGTCTTYDDYTLASQTPTPTPTAVAQTPTPTPTTAIGQCYVYLVQSTVTQSSYGVRYTPPGQGSGDERFSMMLNISGTDVSEFRICSTVEPTLLDYTQGAPTGIGQVEGITRTGPNGSCSSILDCSPSSTNYCCGNGGECLECLDGFSSLEDCQAACDGT